MTQKQTRSARLALDPDRPVIHWISPLPPASTDIAHYSARILPALADHARVVLWTDADTWSAELEAHALVRRLDPDHQCPADFEAAARLVGARPGTTQTLFIHIGNAWVFHSGLLRLARRMPSIVVLHDLAIQEMLNDAIRYGRFDAESYRTDMTTWYGPEGAEAAEICLSGDGRDAQRLAPQMPGFELAVSNALAVLTHTEAATQGVQARESVPVHQFELPFQPGPEPRIRRPRLGPLRLLQFGYIGPNRRLFEVFEALHGLKDQVDFRLDVMGNIWNADLARDHLARLGLEDHVHLHGFVAERVLDQALRQAHLVFNLRHPTLGEASGSQLRIWNAGAAAIVRDAGWYSSLPDDTVFRIPDDTAQEQAALQDLIRRVAEDRDVITPVHHAGRARLLSHHHPSDYAQKIAGLAATTGAAAAQRFLPAPLQIE